MFKNKRAMMMGGYIAALIFGLILGLIMGLYIVKFGILDPAILP